MEDPRPGQHVSLEPLPLVAHDELDDDPFAQPARLYDVHLDDGHPVYSRSEPTHSLQHRLMRVWAERGDYSQLTRDSILDLRTNPDDLRDKANRDAAAANDDDLDPRPRPDELRSLVQGMLENLTIARGELSTALDLLNVLSPATDPPNVDPTTIPLPHESLKLVQTSVPSVPSQTDPEENPLAGFGLAQSLNGLEKSAKLFFQASEELIPLEDDDDNDHDQGGRTDDGRGEHERQGPTLPSSSNDSTRRRRPTRAPDPWPFLLRLHGTPRLARHRLVPVGALPGATLTGKGELRAARQVAVAYACPEAGPLWRRAAVANVRELVHLEARESRGGRRLVIEFETDGSSNDVERSIWDDDEAEDKQRGQQEEDGTPGDVEGILRQRGRSAFSEELFATLKSEVTSNSNLRAEFKLGTDRSMGDSIEVTGSTWRLRISMVHPSQLDRFKARNTSRPPSSRTTSIISPLLRLLFLREYAHRRTRPGSSTMSTLPLAGGVDPPPPSSTSSSSGAAPSSSSSSSTTLLGTISTFLHYLERVEALRRILSSLESPSDNGTGDRGGGLVVRDSTSTELWSGTRKIPIGRTAREAIVNDANDDDGKGAEALDRDGQGGGGGMGIWAKDVLDVLDGAEDLGGRAVVRVGNRYTFHIVHSVPLPLRPSSCSPGPTSRLRPRPSTISPRLATTSTTTTTSQSSTLTLKSPGKPPISIPTMRHLEEFLRAEIARVTKQGTK
ncbi:hypothetical protein JCM10212_000282 [Sporobolomyces blumeae]